MKQVHVFSSGNVHGVGFRFFVKSWARTYRVVGWVRNLDDLRVEGVFAGEEKSVDLLLEKCRKGPFLAEVKGVDVAEEKVDAALLDFRVV